jgi:endoglucanase
MLNMDNKKKVFFIKNLFPLIVLIAITVAQQTGLTINEQEYFEMPGLNVMVFHDFYPEGHQGGVTIIQNGTRVAANGDLRLEPTPGQWQPIPKVGERTLDRNNLLISVPCTYPNPERDRKGFNPITYPDLALKYAVHVTAAGSDFRITVDLDKPVPDEWIGKIGFNLELFPGELFGKMYYMDEQSGLFPRQMNGPVIYDRQGDLQTQSMATGTQLVIAPECDARRMTITAEKGQLQLLDGRAHHNNGWFVVRSMIPANATKNAIQWLVSPNVIPGWHYQPVIHISQVGYHPKQTKRAVIECDIKSQNSDNVTLMRILPSGEAKTVLSKKADKWGTFLRYQYSVFDFSEIQEPGIYSLSYVSSTSQPFRIDDKIYQRDIWQPTLTYFLPVQMCHMRVNDRYRVWHGLCHMDDALMAPTDTLHIDGYQQGSSTLTEYEPLQPVPGLNIGGWHDAGDYDLRVESQAGTVRILAMAHEAFNLDYDQTTIDQQKHLVELHQPDGKNDILQQVEHGVLTILGGYRNLGRLYRGIICPTLRQYVMLGDGSTMTDNKTYNPDVIGNAVQDSNSGVFDDRWVFTEDNPRRELSVAASLAAAARVLKTYNSSLSEECLHTAKALFQNAQEVGRRGISAKIEALTELYLATGNDTYKNILVGMRPEIQRNIGRSGWAIGRLLPLINNPVFTDSITAAVQIYYKNLLKDLEENPFGVPYRPNIWGAGWSIQNFGVHQYYLHTAWPKIVPPDHMFDALNFILGCHPGSNTASFASGVGANSLTVAYGINRADWSYIPGGVASGTAYIRPDFPELKDWPFFWQQTEYVIGGGASNFMFLVLAADQILTEY